ncbi:Ger(x)C family spore germination protein [Paenibacillus yanchengensis]|uniref:Ger(X)C family spore germination protein n=1 Tax=Paenibacillus yanchengensis TaxID=2035833 RepID=A0ABW4YMZ3_9BACL
MGKHKRIQQCLLLFCSMLLLSGCWDLKYLDKLGVVMALGVDEDPTEKGRLQLTVQTVLTQNTTPNTKVISNGPPVTTFTETGDTMFEAIRKMTSKTSRRLFFSHTQILVVSEGIAKKGVYPIIDIIERNPDIRGDIVVIIAKGVTAKQMLEMTTQQETVPANQLYEMVSMNERIYGTSRKTTVQDIVRSADIGSHEAVAAAIKIVGNKNKSNSEQNIATMPAQAYPNVVGVGVFKQGKLVGYLSPMEARGLNWLASNVASTVIKLPCFSSTNSLMVEVLDTKTTIKTRRVAEDEPFFQIEVETTGSVREIMCENLNISEESVLNQIGELTSEHIKAEMEQTIATLQKKLKADALGWGEQVYRHQPKVWKKIHEQWQEKFPQIKYEIICKTVIRGTGVRDGAVTE